jgi:hypothetical protein
MAWFRRTETSTRDYPAAGTSVTGRADRYRQAKTSGARRAGVEAEKWEQKDRARERGQRDGRWRTTRL